MKSALIFRFIFLFLFTSAGVFAAERPNIILIYSDDRRFVVEHGNGLALISDGWKLIPEKQGPKILGAPKLGPGLPVETGNLPEAQLFNLRDDISERHNVATGHPDVVEKLSTMLREIRNAPQKQ